MRTAIRLFTTLLLGMAGPTAAPAAHASAPAGEAADLIARHIAWLGGEEALRSQEALRLEGALTVAGLQGTLTVITRRDGYQRTEYDLKVIKGVEVVTPDDAWELNASGQVETMGADKAAVTRRGIGQTFNTHLLGEDDAKVSSLGTEEHEGSTWSVVRFAYPNGDYLDLFLDPKTGECAWIRSLKDTQTSWVHLSDWREVGGMRHAFRQESTFQEAMQNQTVTWNSIEVVKDVDPALFQRPGASSNPVTIQDPSGSTPWIPVTLFADRYLYLPGTVNGKDIEIILDSGAGMTVLDKPVAEAAGLEGEGALPAVGTGGAVEASVVNGVDIRIGSLELTGLTAAVIDLSEINERLGKNLSVILGKEVFNSVIVDIDYPNRRIAFRDPNRWTYEGEGHVLTLIPGEDAHKRIEMQVEDLPPAVFDLDTGNGGPFVLFKSYVDEHKLLEGRPRVTEAAGGGVGGRTVSKVTSLRSVTLAGYVLHDVPVAVNQAEKGAFHTTRFAGNVGSGILSRFRTIFDYAHDRMILEPGPGWDTTPFRRDRTGIQSDFGKDGLTVHFVAPGSPAEALGFEPGDRIVAVNGKAVGPDYWQGDFRWVYGDEGTKVTLTMADGREVELTLKTYY